MVFPMNTNQKKKNHSQGYLKDLAYLALANSFFKNATSDILRDNPSLIPAPSDNKELLLKVRKELIELSSKIDKVIEAPEHTILDGKKYERFCEILRKEFFKLSHTKAVSFELVGIYTLYSRFVNLKEKKPASSFAFVQDEKKLMYLADMVLSLEIEELSTEWNICYKLARVL